MNPAREVKTERFPRTEGTTPAFVEGEVQRLLSAVETSIHIGLRDRALLGVLAYTFARIGAVVNLKVEDYYPSGKLFFSGLKRKASTPSLINIWPGRQEVVLVGSWTNWTQHSLFWWFVRKPTIGAFWAAKNRIMGKGRTGRVV